MTCSLTLKKLALTTKEAEQKVYDAKNVETPLKYKLSAKERETNESFLKDLSNYHISDSQVSVLSKGLKFIPTPVTNQCEIRQQLL